MWSVNTLRITSFPSPGAEIRDPNEVSWWTQLVGELPTDRKIHPRKGEFQEEGPFAGGKLIWRALPFRIDWRLVPLPPEESLTLLSVLGDFNDVLPTFLDLMNRWFELKTCPPAHRLAFGAILYDFVKERKEGYQKLSEYLHSVKLDSENSSDFFYQINRPRDASTGIEGLKLNRLSKWSVASAQVRGFTVGSEYKSVQGAPEEFACVLELDINTPQSFEGVFPPEKFREIFDELVESGREISKEGDIP